MLNNVLVIFTQMNKECLKQIKLKTRNQELASVSLGKERENHIRLQCTCM